MFNIGEKDSSKKMSPSVVRLEMSKKFKFSDTLKDTQIKSFFANLIKKNKNSNCIKKKKNKKMMMKLVQVMIVIITGMRMRIIN